MESLHLFHLNTTTYSKRREEVNISTQSKNMHVHYIVKGPISIKNFICYVAVVVVVGGGGSGGGDDDNGDDGGVILVVVVMMMINKIMMKIMICFRITCKRIEYC
jgi:hypothetical protein